MMVAMRAVLYLTKFLPRAAAVLLVRKFHPPVLPRSAVWEGILSFVVVDFAVEETALELFVGFVGEAKCVELTLGRRFV